MGENEIEFCLLVERGPLEAQAILLVESIRAFAGRHSGARITALSPRAGWRPSDATRDRLVALGVHYRALDLISPVPEYGPSFRVLATAALAREAGPAVLVVLDSDTVFVGEPDLELAGDLLLARPVDVVGMCSTGPRDPREAHWALMCRLNGVEPDALGWVETAIEGRRVRASYNGGFIAARRALFPEIEAVFERILAAGARAHPDCERGVRIGAGAVGARGYAWWGTSQAAISIAAARLGGKARILDTGHNLPLHLFDRLRERPARLAHLHYHWLFEDSAEAEGAIAAVLHGDDERARWLGERLPLPLRTIEGSGLFSPRPLDLPPLRSTGAGGPACSVIMTSYRDTRFLRAAVDSVLAQQFADFELIVVDDGSPDPAPVAALAALDPRIRTLRLEQNCGTAEAANRGIALSRAPVIARLDSDDIAEPGWLSAVISALDADPALGLVGTAVRLIDEEDREIRVQPMPESDFAIRFTMLFHNPFYQPTTAYRRTLFEAAGGYRPERPVSEDHYLWYAMLPMCRARNLAEPLVRYRINRSGLTHRNSLHNPRARTAAIREALWREIGIPFPLSRLAVAAEADNLLRDLPAADAGARAEAAEIVETALRRAEKLAPDFIRDGEAEEAARFAEALRLRLSASSAQRGRLRQVLGSLGTRALRGGAGAAARRVSGILGRRRGAASIGGRAPRGDVMAALHDRSPYAGFDPRPWPDDLQGWGSTDPAFRMLIARLRPGLIVEIGSWKGASAIHMASLCREFGLATSIVCIDTWLGSAEHLLDLRAYSRESLGLRHGYPQLYYAFLANVVRSGYSDVIVPLPNTSENAAVVLHEKGLRPDLVYVDGNHEEDSVHRDLTAYWPLLAPGGAILGDDYSRFPAVRRAAQRFASEVGAELEDYGDKFVLQRAATQGAAG